MSWPSFEQVQNNSPVPSCRTARGWPALPAACILRYPWNTTFLPQSTPILCWGASKCAVGGPPHIDLDEGSQGHCWASYHPRSSPSLLASFLFAMLPSPWPPSHHLQGLWLPHRLLQVSAFTLGAIIKGKSLVMVSSSASLSPSPYLTLNPCSSQHGPGPAAAAAAIRGSLLETQRLRLCPGQLNQNRHLNKIPGDLCTHHI